MSKLSTPHLRLKTNIDVHAIMWAGSARNSFRGFKDLYLYQTPFKYMNTNILNLTTDVVQ